MNMTDTNNIIYGMMTENTGIHMMDSGGGSGRGWQRNQKKSIEDFMNAPAICMDFGPTVSIFHFFAEHLTHDAEVQEIIDEIAEDNPRDSWFEIRQMFIEQMTEDHGWKFENTYNTYNFETILSQVFEGSEMEDAEGERILIVMLHNGADVRGGYTKPYAFRYRGYWDEFITGMFDYGLYCNNDDCDFQVMVHGPDVYDRDGCPVDIEWQNIESCTCPKCNNETLTPEVYWA